MTPINRRHNDTDRPRSSEERSQMREPEPIGADMRRIITSIRAYSKARDR